MSSDSRQALLREVTEAVRDHQNAVDAFDEAAAVRLGVNRTDLRCMDLLDRAGSMTAGALAAATGLTTGAVTSLLDRLEALGYVRRRRDTADRRRVMVELTARAHDAAAGIWGPVAREGLEALGRYGDAQLVLIRDFLRGGADLLMEHARRLAEPGPQPEGRPARRRRGPRAG